jgi:hypothetical protein
MRHNIEEYHRQRDALVGKSADHLKPPAIYTRGVVLPEDRRSKRTSVFTVVIRILLALLFFGLFGFVFFFGLTGKQ